MIYSIYKNNVKGIGFSEGKPNETRLKACCECIKERLKTFFVPEGAKFETVVQSEPKASSSNAKIISKPKNSKLEAMIKSDSNFKDQDSEEIRTCPSKSVETRVWNLEV